MRYRQVGDSDLTVSVVALGCTSFGGVAGPQGSAEIWGPLGVQAGRHVVDAAREAGVTLLDLADIHAEGHAERVIGEIVKGFRDEIVIATKWGADVRTRPDIGHNSRRYIRQAVEASLGRLQTDYIDLYQMHWQDPLTPLEETLRALDELVQEGKIRYIGSSHLTGWEVAEADWIARSQGLARFVSAQNHYNLLEREAERDLLPACGGHGVGLLAYFPLGKGLLTGKYGRHDIQAAQWLAGRSINGPVDLPVFELLEALTQFADRLGLTLPQLAIAALLAHPGVSSVLTGASSANQIRANAAAADRELAAAEFEELEAILQSADAEVVAWPPLV